MIKIYLAGPFFNEKERHLTGCYYNIKFSDIGKIDLKNLLDNERPSSRGLNAWIVEQK